MPARDFIRIDTGSASATQASLLIAYKNSLRQSLELGIRILGIMGHLNDGAVFTDIEGLFGLPAGAGQAVFNLVNGSVGSMKGQFQVADAQTLTEKLG